MYRSPQGGGLHKALSRQSAFQAGRITLRCSLDLQGSRTLCGSSGATWTTLERPPLQAASDSVTPSPLQSSQMLGVPSDLVPIARHYLHLIASALSRHFLGPLLPTHIPITLDCRIYSATCIVQNLSCWSFLFFFSSKLRLRSFTSRKNAKYSIWFCFKHLNKWKITFLQSICTPSILLKSVNSAVYFVIF